MRRNSENWTCGRRNIEISTSHISARARIHTHTHTQTHRIGLLRTNDQLITETAPYTAQNKYKRQHIHAISVIRIRPINRVAADPNKTFNESKTVQLITITWSLMKHHV